jgi:hypothetical protein
MVYLLGSRTRNPPCEIETWRAATASRDVSEFIFEMNSIGGV